jgi:hypothetical protein
VVKEVLGICRQPSVRQASKVHMLCSAALTGLLRYVGVGRPSLAVNEPGHGQRGPS